MSAIAAITLTDGAATPKNRVFAPTKKEGQVAIYHNRESGIVVGFDALTSQVRPADSKAKTTRLTYKLATPILEQTSPSTSTGIQPAPTVAYTLIGTIEFVLPERCSKQDRKNLRTMMTDLLQEAVIVEAVDDYNFVY